MDVLVRDRQDWDGWNRYRFKKKDDFNRTYIFSLIDFYPEPEHWLFGGIYKVLTRGRHGYKVGRLLDHEALVGRLKIHFKRPSRTRAVKLENYYSDMIASELMAEPYTGERFPGYENVSHNFDVLETIFQNHRPDWMAALQNVKGVYLVADKRNGKRYVGSAYGGSGVWSRWSCYIGTGHGWNDELTKLIEREGLEYARKHFRISLLEYRPAKTDDQVIFDRENYWKNALLSRSPLGYNKN